MAARNRTNAGSLRPARRGSFSVSGAEAGGCAGFSREQREKDPGGGERRHAVGEKQRRPRNLREEPAHGGADAHAEVRREALERERCSSAVGDDRVRDDAQARGPEGLRDEREEDREAGDGEWAARERKEEEERARDAERARHHAHGPEPVRQPAGDRRRQKSSRTEEREDRAGGRRRVAARPREVEDEERHEHRAGAVHERGGGEHPDRARKAREAAPGIHPGS